MGTLLSAARDRLTLAGLKKPVIDTHLHLWANNNLPAVVRPAIGVRPDLNANFDLPYYAPILDALPIGGVIAVQARDPADEAFAEAEYLNSLGKMDARFLAVVAGVDLTKGDAVQDDVLKLRNLERVRGVRMIAPENSGAGIYGSRNALGAALRFADAGYTLDLLIRESNPGQLSEVVRFAGVVLGAHRRPLVLDHLGKPVHVYAGVPSAAWLAGMSELGKSGRVYVKLSALRGEAGEDADRDALFRFYDAALERFGPNNLLFGSDHPVSFDYGDNVLDVAQWILARGMQGTGIADRIFHDNAFAAYGIQPPAA